MMYSQKSGSDWEWDLHWLEMMRSITALSHALASFGRPSLLPGSKVEEASAMIASVSGSIQDIPGRVTFQRGFARAKSAIKVPSSATPSTSATSGTIKIVLLQVSKDRCAHAIISTCGMTTCMGPCGAWEPEGLIEIVTTTTTQPCSSHFSPPPCRLCLTVCPVIGIQRQHRRSQCRLDATRAVPSGEGRLRNGREHRAIQHGGWGMHRWAALTCI